MKIAIGVTWIPRKVETFQTMQHNVFHTDCTVYPDGYPFPHRTDFTVKELGDNVGCFKHYYRVLEDLCKTDADIVGIFPDDVKLRQGWQNIAERQFNINPYIGYLALYTPKGMASKFPNTKGWHEIKGGWASSWGGGYMFRREVAKKILKHPYILNHRDNYAKNQQIDHAIPEAIHQMGYLQFFHTPSLIQHIGRFSTIGHVHRKIDDAIGW